MRLFIMEIEIPRRNNNLLIFIDLERSTEMFGHLADPNGANNPLSQVLYGLALRYEFAFLTVRHNLKKQY